VMSGNQGDGKGFGAAASDHVPSALPKTAGLHPYG
jgi:hypothetical protein